MLHHTLNPPSQSMGKGSTMWTGSLITLSQAVRIDDEVNTGIARAMATFWEARLKCLGTQRNDSVYKAKGIRSDHLSINLVCMRNLDCPVGVQES